MSVIHLPSFRVLNVAHRIASFVRGRALRLVWLASRPFGNEYAFIANRWVGEIGWWEWTEEEVKANGRFFDVWKEGPAHSDLMAGFDRWRDVWKYRGSFVYMVRIGRHEFQWQSAPNMARLERRRERTAERFSIDTDTDTDAHAPTQD